MSTLNNPVSYKYEFIDQVPEEYSLQAVQTCS